LRLNFSGTDHYSATATYQRKLMLEEHQKRQKQREEEEERAEWARRFGLEGSSSQFDNVRLSADLERIVHTPVIEGDGSNLDSMGSSDDWCLVDEQEGQATPFSTLTEERSLISTSCEWISPNRVRVGKMEVTNVAIYFIDEGDQVDNNPLASPSQTSLEQLDVPRRPKNRRWPLEKLRQMLRRRYVIETQVYTCEDF